MGIFHFLKLDDAVFDGADDLAITVKNKERIEQKPFLKRLYTDFYRQIRDQIDPCLRQGLPVLEVGSGGGFMQEVIPEMITSDILPVAGLDHQCSASELCFEDGTLGAICMLNVFHHIRQPAVFLQEAVRTLQPGGKIVMVEPANTVFRRVVDAKFHHEPFDPTAGWELPSGGPLSTANGALPWIVFMRDRVRLREEFPMLQVTSVKRHTPLRYLLSGGLSYRPLLPAWMYKPVAGLEWLLTPVNGLIGYFQTIVITKREMPD